MTTFELSAPGCQLRLTEYDAHSVLVTVAGPPSATIHLRSHAHRATRLTDLDRGRHLEWIEGVAEVETDATGSAWLMVYEAPPDISIYSRRPASLLRLPATEPLRAAFPVVDVHAHLKADPDSLVGRLPTMDALNVRTVISSGFAERGENTELTATTVALMPADRFMAGATVDWRQVREVGGEAVAEQLRRDAEHHQPVLVGEMHEKGYGIDDPGVGPVFRDRLLIDDPRLDPVWHAAADLQLPVILHCADDPAHYRPWDADNEALPQLYRSPWKRRRAGGLDADEVRARRDSVLRRHPRLRFIAAHFDSSAHDLSGLAERLRRYPNLYVELGQRHRVLARQPRASRRFFEEFADRVCFGGDQTQQAEDYLEEFRVLETEDEAFPSGDELDRQPLYGLGLPPDILRQIYSGTASALMPSVDMERRLPTASR